MTETEPIYFEDEHQHSGLLEGKQTSLSYRKHKRAKQYQPTSIGVNNMAIPDSSLTRLEKYLNNIATGEGAIPDVPLTRIEQYLDYIAKNGGSGGGGSGGGVVFVDCSMSESETDTTLTATKTAGEIFGSIMDGNVVVFRLQNGDLAVLMPCLHADNIGGKYTFAVINIGGSFDDFTADTASDYPRINIPR